jgi:hypothetical protein
LPEWVAEEDAPAVEVLLRRLDRSEQHLQAA